MQEDQVKEVEEDLFELGMPLMELDGLDCLDDMHPVFAKCMVALSVIMPFSETVLSNPSFSHDRKIIDKAEKKYRPWDPSTPVFDSLFESWMVLDLDVRNSNSVIADAVLCVKELFSIDKEIISSIESMRDSHMGVYKLVNKSGEEWIFKELPSGRELKGFLDLGWHEVIDEGDIVLMRFVKDSTNDSYVQLSTPYIIQATEDEWIEFFNKHEMTQKDALDHETYKVFMKKGISADFWLEYVHNSCISIEDMVAVLNGVPS